MKTRTTLLLLAVAAGLMAFIQLYEKWQLSTREAGDHDQFVLAFDPSGIDGIAITSNEDKIVLRKNGSRWELEAPLKDRADPNAVNEILTRAGMLRKDAALSVSKGEEKKLFKDFGVAKSTLRLKLLGRGAPPEIWFGKDTAVEGKAYVRLDDSKHVYVVGTELRDLIVRKAEALRDHRLTEIQAAHVTQLGFRTATGEIALTKTGDHWGLNKPLRARADDLRVGELVSAILDTEIAGFAEAKSANLNSYGLSEPRVIVTFATLSDDKPVTLEIGGRDSKTDNTYARISNRDAVYLLPKRIERLLTLKPNELRDRHLLRVDLDLVDRLTIDPRGKTKLVFQRQHEQWMLRTDRDSTRPVNQARIQSLMKFLQTRPINDFVSDVASDPSKYGLDHPQLRVIFSSYASENTAESNAGERPFLTVSFGNGEGNTVYARIDEEPFIVSVDKSFLDEISANPVVWRALPVFQLKSEEITALEVTYGSDASKPAPVSLVRKDGSWQAATPSGSVNNVNVQSLVNTLANLSAVRWTTADTSTLASPSEVIAFKTTGGQSRKLILGSQAADKTCNAMIEGDSAVFSISTPDESALRLLLTNP